MDDKPSSSDAAMAELLEEAMDRAVFTAVAGSTLEGTW